MTPDTKGAKGETLLWQAIDEGVSFAHHILLVRQKDKVICTQPHNMCGWKSALK